MLEIIELGISGSKSIHESSDENIIKCEKQINPISKRVSEAAEELLVQLVFDFILHQFKCFSMKEYFFFCCSPIF